MTHPLPFPLHDKVPPQLQDYLLNFWWDEDKLHRLKLTEETWQTRRFVTHLDLPYWRHDGQPFKVTPNQVRDAPDTYREQYERTMRADLSYPIIVYPRAYKPTIILDGTHRLLKAVIQGESTIRVAIFDESLIPEILHQV